MKPGMDDRSVAQRVLDHIANGTTDVGDAVWREPVVNYRSSERLAAEIEQVLRRFHADLAADHPAARPLGRADRHRDRRQGVPRPTVRLPDRPAGGERLREDRKSTRLNSSHRT